MQYSWPGCLIELPAFFPNSSSLIASWFVFGLNRGGVSAVIQEGCFLFWLEAPLAAPLNSHQHTRFNSKVSAVEASSCFAKRSSQGGAVRDRNPRGGGGPLGTGNGVKREDGEHQCGGYQWGDFFSPWQSSPGRSL